MRLLLDANLFLEVLLQQRQARAAEELLDNPAAHELYISDFALHAVCLIALRHKEFTILTKFLADIISAGSSITVIAIPSEDLVEVVDTVQLLGLDFDDAYQYVLAEKNNLTLVSFDRDFDKTPRGRQTPQAINQLASTNNPTPTSQDQESSA